MNDETSFKSLPKDVIELLSKDLSSQDLINLCKSSMSEQTRKACNSQEFWKRRFQQDFSFLYPFIDGDTVIDKKLYLRIFSTISKKAELISESVLNLYTVTLNKYLNKELLKKDTYETAYRYVLDVIKFSLKEKKEDNILLLEQQGRLTYRNIFQDFVNDKLLQDININIYETIKIILSYIRHSDYDDKPLFLENSAINFLKNTNFGNVPGANYTINNLLAQLLEVEVLNIPILISLLSIYKKMNNRSAEIDINSSFRPYNTLSAEEKVYLNYPQVKALVDMIQKAVSETEKLR